MPRVQIKPEMLRWARERAGLSFGQLEKRFPKLDEWEHGAVQPTLRQVERFAKATHTAVGYLFLQEPPEEHLPLKDFRTLTGTDMSRPSPDLLDTIYLCQRRQEWYRLYLRAHHEDTLPFVGSADLASDPVETAADIAKRLGFTPEDRQNIPTWTDALRSFVAATEEIGIMVMANGVVGVDTHRSLDPQEFRGFALVDDLAPLIFINGADAKTAQIFTLAHEIAHIWLGQGGVDDIDVLPTHQGTIERWCNRVAAELLVPMAHLRTELSPSGDPQDEIGALARRFKVSTLVIARRLHEADLIDERTYLSLYGTELKKAEGTKKSAGGDFHRTLKTRVGDRFARAIVTSTLEGETTYSEAFRLLGIKKAQAFDRFAEHLERS